MNICSYSYKEYVNLVKSFHGYVAPGVVVGGFMVDLAVKNLPKDILFDAMSETSACLPDAIQLLTPCTIGNGWLKVFNMGRFAIALYEKYEGEGIRIFIDPNKLEIWPEIKTWFFKLKPKKESDSQLLLEEIEGAGASICGIQQVKVPPQFRKKKHRSGFAICPLCKEAYPVDDGEICHACQGETPYVVTEAPERSKR
ncbi:FmdE family protein [Chloroflexota bacterium]